jgi:nucleoside-diphosphate-sugar epimerase
MIDLACLISRHFCVELQAEDIDPLEKERWIISIEKAQHQLGYSPQYSGENLIREFLSHLKL